MRIYLSVLCSLSCTLLVLDTTRDLAFRVSNFGCCRYHTTSGIKSHRFIVVIEVRVLDRGFELFVVSRSVSGFETKWHRPTRRRIRNIKSVTV